MKIGILTFHWATNYGAILQCYALQTYLENLGHDVEVIDYKPKQYDDTLYAFFRFRKFLNVCNYFNNRRKETPPELLSMRICSLGFFAAKTSKGTRSSA